MGVCRQLLGGVSSVKRGVSIDGAYIYIFSLNINKQVDLLINQPIEKM